MLDTIDAYVDPRNKVVDVERYFLESRIWNLEYRRSNASIVRTGRASSCIVFDEIVWTLVPRTITRDRIYTVCKPRDHVRRGIRAVVRIDSVGTYRV